MFPDESTCPRDFYIRTFSGTETCDGDEPYDISYIVVAGSSSNEILIKEFGIPENEHIPLQAVVNGCNLPLEEQEIDFESFTIKVSGNGERDRRKKLMI